MIILRTVEEAKEAGLDISRYRYTNSRWWLNAPDAAALLSYTNERPVDTGYLDNPVKQGRLNPDRVSPKCNFYAFDELVKIELLVGGRPQLADDQVTASALRQRKFKEKRRAERLAQKERVKNATSV